MSIEIFRSFLESYSIDNMFKSNSFLYKKFSTCEELNNLRQMISCQYNFVELLNLSYEKRATLYHITKNIISNYLKNSTDWVCCFSSEYIDIYFSTLTAGIKEYPIVFKYINKMRNHNIIVENPIYQEIHAENIFYNTIYAPYGDYFSINNRMKIQNKVQYEFSLRFDISSSDECGIYDVSCHNAIINKHDLVNVTESLSISSLTQDKLIITLNYLETMGLLTKNEVEQIVSKQPLNIDTNKKNNRC